MILFTVMDHDVLTFNDFAGEAYLSLNQVRVPAALWLLVDGASRGGPSLKTGVGLACGKGCWMWRRVKVLYGWVGCPVPFLIQRDGVG